MTLFIHVELPEMKWSLLKRNPLSDGSQRSLVFSTFLSRFISKIHLSLRDGALSAIKGSTFHMTELVCVTSGTSRVLSRY